MKISWGKVGVGIGYFDCHEIFGIRHFVAYYRVTYSYAYGIVVAHQQPELTKLKSTGFFLPSYSVTLSVRFAVILSDVTCVLILHPQEGGAPDLRAADAPVLRRAVAGAQGPPPLHAPLRRIPPRVKDIRSRHINLGDHGQGEDQAFRLLH